MKKYKTGSDICSVALASKESKFLLFNNNGDGDNYVYICENDDETKELLCDLNKKEDDFQFIGRMTGKFSLLEYDTHNLPKDKPLVMLDGNFRILVKKEVGFCYDWPCIILEKSNY